MSGTPKVYVICDANCRWEGMTREQILTAITQAVNEGTIGDIDTGFITTVKTINGTPLKFFVGAQHEYDALSDEDKQNLFAIITNDTTKEGIWKAIEELQENKETFENVMTGNYPVPKALADGEGRNIAQTYFPTLRYLASSKGFGAGLKIGQSYMCQSVPEGKSLADIVAIVLNCANDNYCFFPSSADILYGSVTNLNEFELTRTTVGSTHAVFSTYKARLTVMETLGTNILEFTITGGVTCTLGTGGATFKVWGNDDLVCSSSENFSIDIFFR